MILVDANLLIYAYNSSVDVHERARTSYWTVLQSLLRQANVRGPLVMDAHLAALAVENDAILHTTDRDFRRFEGVRVRNPLTP